MQSAHEILIYEAEYGAWANANLISQCISLTETELEKDLGGSFGSVLATLRHIFDNDHFWLDTFRGADHPPVPSSLSMAELQNAWPAVDAAWIEYVKGCDEAELNRRIFAFGVHIPVWRLVLHSINHDSGHRGQVISKLRQLGYTPRNIDIFSFHMDKG